ncbi:hypothetical protein ACFQYP_17430 [Nonomuraea antimicrobica]
MGPAERAEAIGVRAVRDELIARLSTRCVPKEEAVSVVRSVLTAKGLHEWSVRVEPSAEGGKCATFGMDQKTRSVYLVMMNHP